MIPYKPFQAGITILNLIVELILLLVVVCAIAQYVVYFFQYSNRPDSEATKVIRNFLLRLQ